MNEEFKENVNQEQEAEAWKTPAEPAPQPQPAPELISRQGDAPGYEQPPAPPIKGDGSTSKAVIALVLGISAICLCLTFYLGIIGLPCAIIGLIFSIKERKEHPSGIATAGFILSLIGLILCVLSAIACVACACFLGFASYQDYFNDPNWINTLPSMDTIYY